MKSYGIDVVRGNDSGNVYRDFGYADADVRHLKALMAAAIVKSLDRQGLTVREAHAVTGTAAADFSRIRQANLDRFTVDRLVTILNRLGARIDVRITVSRAPARDRQRAIDAAQAGD
jgi:predicted XRE-type DNA-binding protein